MARTRQVEMKEIAREVDGGEFTDIDLVEGILSDRVERKRYRDSENRKTKTLAERLVDRNIPANDQGVIEITVGEGETEHLVQLKMKEISDYDLIKLAELNNCKITREQLFLVVKQVPSGRQLQALSDHAGAAAREVIEASKRRTKTDIPTIKIRKPRKKGRRAHAGQPFR